MKFPDRWMEVRGRAKLSFIEKVGDRELIAVVSREISCVLDSKKNFDHSPVKESTNVCIRSRK